MFHEELTPFFDRMPVCIHAGRNCTSIIIEFTFKFVAITHISTDYETPEDSKNEAIPRNRPSGSIGL
jgi:hypothetical protein